MKLMQFLRAFSLLLIISLSISSYACGPFFPIIPTPRYFSIDRPVKSMSEYDKEENLLLWQQLTSPDIPLSDIEEAVYSDNRDIFMTKSHTSGSDNLFYNFLNDKEGEELRDFLSTAKEMEERWKEIRSPWYYPKERDTRNTSGEFQEIIDKCKAYSGSKLADRYALQAVRALFASRKYEQCIQYADSVFRSVLASNLLKRMAERYVAGCWNRLGNKQRADSIFARNGDLLSISEKNQTAYMIARNPDAPQLMDYIRCNANDSAFMEMVMPLASDLLKKGKPKYAGDWYLLLAYGQYQQKNNLLNARKYVRNAVNSSFSSPELQKLAHAFKMKLDAARGDSHSLLSDLKWMEDVILSDTSTNEWGRMTQNIIYQHWVPLLWKKRDYAKAILLCAYADKFPQTNGEFDSNDYSNLSFQMMGSLSSGQLASVFRTINRSTPLNNFLRRKARTDKDYYYELIGTLAIREEKYDRAVKFLSQVSPQYLDSLTICKDGYLSRDPFTVYPSRWSYYGDDDMWASETQAGVHKKTPAADAKLKFASKMREYKKEMKEGKTADKRGMARLMYVIGRFNSFEECWALTQYWRGTIINRFYPTLQYWDDDYAKSYFDFLFDYDRTIGHRKMESCYDKEITKALNMLSSDEARAEAQYILGNLKTIVKKYPDTAISNHIKSSCDNWKTWL
ncbi:MAG: hypothetical protein K2H46_09410 [Muribaculaceae bacterium]|nr:hypothetical protein [Muribaculaceae bacterium]